ncbi:MAG: PaaI family thioesterase [Alphaproteobacteria bacterium]|nr:PaaI family thioesterase [Alphaproteobacteria bacterium]
MNQKFLPEASLPSRPNAEAFRDLGWETYAGVSPFSAPHGQMYQKISGDGICWRAFCAGRAHCNSAGIVHGGMMVAFMDALMGYAVANSTRSRALTIRLTSDFLSIARPGDWIVGQSMVTRVTRSVVFVEGMAHAGQRPLFSAQGIFKRMRERNRPA